MDRGKYVQINITLNMKFRWADIKIFSFFMFYVYLQYSYIFSVFYYMF